MVKIVAFFRRHSFTLIVLLALIVGFAATNTLLKKPKVAIIQLREKISGDFSQDLVKQISYAYDNEEIKAVVLDISSTGGEAAATENIYLAMLRLRERKPIVAAIQQAGASGAYYIATAANHIYSTPTATVGSIGVVSVLPKPEDLDDDTIVSGPFKRVGATRKRYAYELRAVQEGFLRAVEKQRSGKLKLSKQELSEARTYLGVEAFNNGLVDEIGSIVDAQLKAAQLAGIANYDTVYLKKDGEVKITISFENLSADANDLTNHTNTVPVYYYQYLGVD